MDDLEDVVDAVEDVTEGVMQLGVKKTLGLAGVLSGIFGFVADVLQPIAPFAIYLCIASFVLLVGATVYYLKFKKGLVVGVVALVSTVVLGGLWLVQSGAEAEEEGVLAKMVPAVKGLQKSMGMLNEKVDEIKGDTEEIKARTAEIQENSERTVQNTEKLVDSHQQLNEKSDKLLAQGEKTTDAIDKLGESLGGKVDGLAQLGGIKPKPSSASDYYHNAKIYELKGDYGNAQRSYKKYFTFKTGKLEPHLRLVDFLKVNEGSSGAREMYGLIVRGQETTNSKFVKLMLVSDSKTRVSGLKEFAVKHPDYAPVFYILSKEFSFMKLGKQSFSDKKNEYKWLTKVDAMNKEQKLVKYFVDKERLSEWQEDIATRTKLAKRYLNIIKAPMSASWMRHNHGINCNIVVSEPALEIEYRKKGEGDYKSMGHMEYNDPRTGKPQAQTYFELQKDHEPAEFEVRYTNADGVKSDVLVVKLEQKHVTGSQVVNGKIELDPQIKKMAINAKNSWVTYGDRHNKDNVYFTSLLLYRGMFSKVLVGYDVEQPNEELKFPVYNKAGIAGIDESVMGLVFKKIPKGNKFISCQVFFKDGTVSDVIKYKRPK